MFALVEFQHAISQDHGSRRAGRRDLFQDINLVVAGPQRDTARFVAHFDFGQTNPRAIDAFLVDDDIDLAQQDAQIVAAPRWLQPFLRIGRRGVHIGGSGRGGLGGLDGLVGRGVPFGPHARQFLLQLGVINVVGARQVGHVHVDGTA